MFDMLSKSLTGNKVSGEKFDQGTDMQTSPPDNPAGVFFPTEKYNAAVRKACTEEIWNAPQKLREIVEGLSDEQLETPYKNWTIRQIVHHIADSHVHSYIRFKWALTEKHPTIKAYEEADWVQLVDAKDGDIDPSLALLTGLHAKWVQTLDSMTESDFDRTFLHPQSGETVSLWNALNYYPWHGQHHTAQIQWLCDTHGWR